MPTRIFAKVLAHAKSVTTFTQNLFTSPHQSFLDANGDPLSGGMLYVYEAGTSTPTNTWQDAALTQLNTNPVILDSGGFASVWLDPTQTYKFRMTNAQGAQQWTIDDYAGGSLTANILVPLSYLLGATGANTIDNGSFDQTWTWELTGTSPVSGLAITEATASTNTSGQASLLNVSTLPGSTAIPLNATVGAAGLRVLPTGDIAAIGGANILTNIVGMTQCVQVDSGGRLFGTGAPCGAGGSGGGGGPNFSDNEVVAGSGTSWTLSTAPTPVGSLQLYQYLTGFGQILLRATVDYTLSGRNITTVNSLAVGALRAWYRF